MNQFEETPIPEATLPKWTRTALRPFSVESVPRELRKAAAGSGTCDNLRLFSKDVGGTLELWHTAGQAGDELFDEASLGTLEDAYGKFFVVKFTLVDDTATATVSLESSLPTSTDSEKYVLMGRVSDAGSISGGACFANVEVCRDWFTPDAPLYGMNVTAS